MRNYLKYINKKILFRLQYSSVSKEVGTSVPTKISKGKHDKNYGML